MSLHRCSFMFWMPLMLHYVLKFFGPLPTISTEQLNELSRSEEVNELSKLVAYYFHIVTMFLFIFWLSFLVGARRDEQDESSKEDENARHVVVVED